MCPKSLESNNHFAAIDGRRKAAPCCRLALYAFLKAVVRKWATRPDSHHERAADAFTMANLPYQSGIEQSLLLEGDKNSAANPQIADERRTPGNMTVLSLGSFHLF